MHDPIRIDFASTYRNLTVSSLIEESIRRCEGQLSHNGALVVQTGKFTGRSPGDKYIVEEPGSQQNIWWGPVNQALPEASFESLYRRCLEYLSDRHVFRQDLYGGADIRYRLPVRLITEFAWHSLFGRQLFVRPDLYGDTNNREEGKGKREKAREAWDRDAYTVLCAPGCRAVPAEDGTRSETFIAIHFGKRLVLIGGTEYAGEIKKSIFTILNYLLPLYGMLPMHCSANIGQKNGDTALFFGLSGTGKTTLSADPTRDLIGDDEHGWSDEGVFNFEGGCYAKCIRLSRQAEPEIWNAIRYGAVLENVVMDPITRDLDFDNAALTENTRAAYPIDYIPHARIPGLGDHPRNVVFLTADAFGVLPPIARLTIAQALYHFLSGYTAKVAGTERGLGSEPQATFSACFGQPFLPLHPTRYAQLLGEKLRRHRVNVWLVNTGWTGGPYGIGHRMRIAHTRAILNAAIEGALERAEFRLDPRFGFRVPLAVDGVPGGVLEPHRSWSDPEAYDRQSHELARLFTENFKRYETEATPEMIAAAPRLD
jgi:phosphoenolpyruvate carboxykinase (ATP)